MVDSDRNDSLSLEERIASDVWQWAFANDEVRREVVAPTSDFAGRLEFYLSGLLANAPGAATQRMWCDGVFEPSITRLSRTSFRIAGEAYLDNSHVGPYELEFHFARRRGMQPIRVILRCGYRGETDRVRPPRDDEWAIAVEFTREEEQ